MALTSSQTTSLHTELTTDPDSIGYAPYVASGDDGTLASMLNAPRTGQTCQSGPLTPQQVLGAITITDLASGQDTALLAWTTLINTMPVGLDLNNSKVAAVFNRFFAAGTASYNALLALRTVNGCSRAQALFGVSCVIAASDVAAAMGR